MNKWLEENRNQIDYYISSKDVILVDRKKHLELMAALFKAYFPEPKGLRCLDVGCGDGTVSRMLSDLFTENEFHLLDGSRTMLEKARESMKGANAVFHQDTVERFFESEKHESYYNFIFSSMVMHHVEHFKKRELFSRIHTLLADGGLFLAIDVVLPVSDKTEEIQFRMWTDYINGLLAATDRSGEIGSHDDLPAVYKGKSENKPSPLMSQLNMLTDIGFRDVECYMKNGIFVLFAGVK